MNYSDYWEQAKKKLAEAWASMSDKKYSYIFNIVIVLLINLVAFTLYFRWDLTRNGVYSLSGVSREVVSTLEDPLIIKVFFSKDLPAPYNSVHRYLVDLLEEYSQKANRNFRYEIVDVEKDKEAASNFGMYPVQVRELKSDQVKFRNAFMGLALVHGDLVEKIESLTETEGMEYKITTLIKKMNGKIDVLQKIDKPIRVTLYASGNLPVGGTLNLHEKVADAVKRCGRRNYDKLEFRHLGPNIDRGVMEAADSYGVPRLKWPTFTGPDGKTYVAGEGIIGIVVEHGDRFEPVAILSQNMMGQYVVAGLETLEDRINNAVGNLISVNPRIGYITGHGEKDLMDERGGARHFRDIVSDMYELKAIDLTKEPIPDELSAIIVNGPRGKFGEDELFKIDQFVMKGKAVLFLLDSFQEINPQAQNPMMREPMVLPVNTGLEPLLEHYGIVLGRDIVLDRNCFKTSQRGVGEMNIFFAPLIDEYGLSRENVVTRYLKRIIFLKSSSLTFKEERIKSMGLNRSVLVSSSDNSWLMKGRISFMPWSMAPQEGQKMTSYALCALLTGRFESYFKDREIPVGALNESKDLKDAKGPLGKKEQTKPAEPGKKTPVTEEKLIVKSLKPARVILAGTSEITGSNVIDREGNSPNAVFIHNMMDYLSGNYDIPEMRSKGLEFNPLRELSDFKRTMLKVFNIAVLPLLVVAAGMIVWKLRAIRKKKIMEFFSRGGTNAQ